MGHALNNNRAPTNDARRRGASTGLGMDRARARANGYGTIRLPPEVAEWKTPIKASGPLPVGIPAGDDGVPRINRRRPINFELAGGVIMPSKPEVARLYPDGVRMKPNGFPDFTPYAVASVEIDGPIGDTSKDFRAANKAAGLERFGDRAPRGFVWHHCEDGRTMQLVPFDIHDAVKHTGGEAVLEHLQGTKQ